MTSIYQHILGGEFDKLHPMLQKRYNLTEDKGFIGKGVMEEISGGNILTRQLFYFGVPYHVFFPERGKNIPFIIENKVREAGIVEWNRTFSFNKQQRYFDAIMFLDEKGTTIVDLFGKPAILGSNLSFEVDETKGSLQISSLQQWLIVKGKRLPLPRLLQGKLELLNRMMRSKKCLEYKLR